MTAANLPTIRKAGPGDALPLSRLAEATFRATFGAVNSAENMARHCEASYGEGIQALEIANANRVTLLAEHAGALIGFAQLKWERTPACITVDHAGEIQRLYVAEAWHGKGIAQTLMDACLEELRRHGSDVAWLGVWEHNPRAISFYKKLGFAVVGEQVFPLGDDPQRDMVMAKPIADSCTLQDA